MHSGCAVHPSVISQCSVDLYNGLVIDFLVYQLHLIITSHVYWLSGLPLK